MKVKGIPGVIETYASRIAADQFGCTIDEFRRLKEGEEVELSDPACSRLLAHGLVVGVMPVEVGEGKE